MHFEAASISTFSAVHQVSTATAESVEANSRLVICNRYGALLEPSAVYAKLLLQYQAPVAFQSGGVHGLTTSLKPSSNSKSPGRRYSALLHFLQRRPGASPLVPA